VKFLFDEQLPPRVARGLRQLGEPVSHVQDVAELGKGSPDDEILEYAGKRDYFLVTLDRQIRRKPHLRARYMASGCGVYFLRAVSKKSTSYWEMVRLIVNRWPEIVADCGKRKCPFMVLVSAREGLKKVS
jgi:predicted nuclease of predicted toxin-antitoxin system